MTKKTSKYKLKRYDSDCYQIFEGDKIVAFALRLSNDSWALTDTNLKRNDKRFFPKPAKVLEYWESLKDATKT